MRVLTVRQPWAWAIIHGGKDVENRSRNIAGSYRGPVAIHAGLAFADEALGDEMLSPVLYRAARRYRKGGLDGLYERGAIIGVVDLVDVHRSHINGVACGSDLRAVCSKWALYDGHHLVLKNPRAFTTPIPATGRLGLWRPDDALLAQIQEALR